jgi:hypothetical protein
MAAMAFVELVPGVIVPCFAHQYSKRYVMDIIVYCKANWIPPYTYIYIHTLTPTLNLTLPILVRETWNDNRPWGMSANALYFRVNCDLSHQHL